MPSWSAGRWINPPTRLPHSSERAAAEFSFQTDPGTDFWQRTYYGFRNANAPALLFDRDDNFTMSVTVQAEYEVLFDQAGVIVWVDDDNWIKASVEYENETFSRLGAVVTNTGYSDWSTRNSPALPSINFKVSRRGPDFLIEANTQNEWEQLRIAHLSVLGDTTLPMGQMAAHEIAIPPAAKVAVGIYACSPGESSFEAHFSGLAFTPSCWEPHS